MHMDCCTIMREDWARKMFSEKKYSPSLAQLKKKMWQVQNDPVFEQGRTTTQILIVFLEGSWMISVFLFVSVFYGEHVLCDKKEKEGIGNLLWSRVLRPQAPVAA